MKGRTWSFAVVSLLFATLALPAAAVKARDADDKPLTLAAAQSSKQKHINACRSRYRDCLKLNQIPSFECQYIYQDRARNII
jgi:hypothetical protein